MILGATIKKYASPIMAMNLLSLDLY